MPARPTTPQGEEAAKQASDWADASVTSLEDAQDALDEEPDTLEEALAAAPCRDGCDRGDALKSGVTTVAGVASLDPALAAALRDSSTCQQLREEEQLVMSTTDWVLVAVQGLVVIGFIALGVRSGGIGLGLWGGVGTLVLVFVFGLDPGEPPISAILIIIAVVSAAAAMQAAGGVDYMVSSRARRCARGRRRSTSSRHTSRTSSRS